MSDLQLSKVTVLDLASVGPAARCSRILADYGANVIKIAPAPGKGKKQIQPPYFSYGAGRGIRRMLVDLKDEDGKAAFLKLAAKADVIIESFRPGVTDRLGLGYKDIRSINDGIIYCSTTGYGQDGPHALWAGHDLNYLAVGGYLDCSARRGDGGPPIPGATVADSAAGGMHAVISILAALVSRNSTGRGAYLDVSVADGVLSLMSLHIDDHLATGATPGPGSGILTGRYAYYDTYQCKDGKWLSVAAIEPQFYANLLGLLDLNKWASHQHDDQVQDEIRADFRRVFATRDRDDWVGELAPADTCVAPVYSVPELVSDEQFRHRNAFLTVNHPEHGSFEQVGAVLAGGPRTNDTVPVDGSDAIHTDQVLAEAGLSADDISKMREAGVIG